MIVQTVAHAIRLAGDPELAMFALVAQALLALGWPR